MSKLLSQGGFGCVFYPGFKTNGKLLNNKYIVKIQKNNFNSNNEINISYTIKKIDDYDKYFIPVLSSFNVNFNKIKKYNLKECRIIKNFDSKKYISLKLKFFDNYKINFIYKNLIKKNSTLELSIFLFNSYKLLLECLIKLFSVNIIHFDLKTDNILFDKNTYYPKIIDFGISIDLTKLNDKNIQKYFYIYAPDYYIWCLEIHFINYLLYENNTIDHNDIKNITYEYFNNNLFNTFNKNDINKLINKSIEFYSKYIGKSRNIIIQDLLKYSGTWDNYSLSILFLTMIDKKQLKFYKILLKNIDSNPKNRYTLDKTLEEFNIFLSELDINNIYIQNTYDLLTNYQDTIIKFENKLIQE